MKRQPRYAREATPWTATRCARPRSPVTSAYTGIAAAVRTTPVHRRTRAARAFTGRMMNRGVGINDEPSAPSAECWGGGAEVRAEARGLSGAREGGHAKRSTEQPRPQHVVRLVFGARGTPREATTAAGQKRAPCQPHKQHEQRRESDNAEAEG